MARIYVTFAFVVAVISALAFGGLTRTAAHSEDRQQRDQHTAAEHVRRRAGKARKRVRRRAVSYVCPMHPDMQSKSRGECPKCGMDLIVERRRASLRDRRSLLKDIAEDGIEKGVRYVRNK